MGDPESLLKTTAACLMPDRRRVSPGPSGDKPALLFLSLPAHPRLSSPVANTVPGGPKCVYPLAALCAPCFIPPAGCRGHRREMWGHVPRLCGKLRRQGGKPQPRPSQAESDRAQALWPHAPPRLGRLRVSLPGAQVRPWLLAPASLWPAHPETPSLRFSSLCPLLASGPAPRGRGRAVQRLPDPTGCGALGLPAAPRSPVCRCSAVRLLLQEGPGPSRPRGCHSPSAQALGSPRWLGAPWVPQCWGTPGSEQPLEAGGVGAPWEFPQFTSPPGCSSGLDS